ncbi:MAG: MBL fold metallo-hydrolase [Lachnospiraceae bacterium]|nr:MBL fold metallo-hydrolase [Lachnospiraceae bacterium]
MKLYPILEGKPFQTEFGIVGYSTVALIRDGEMNILFDCGQRGCALQLKQGLARAGVTCEDITHVVVSHLHFDHVGNLPLFQNAEILMSETEWEEACVQPDEWHCRATREYIRHECRVHYVKEGDRLTENVEVLELPGHTRGLIGLRCGEDTILCSDAIKNRYEMWEDRPLMCVDEAASRATQARIRREGRVIWPGHDTILYADRPIHKETVHFRLLYANGTERDL